MKRALICSLWLCLAPMALFAKSATVQQETEALECFFHPPKGWEMTDWSALSSHIQIAFLKPSGKGFSPSINLAIEKTSVSLSEYLKAVKAIHERDRKNEWRFLGKVKTAAGLAQLTEIDTPSDAGPLRILQLLLMKQGYVYILTAAALKEDIAEYYEDFQSAFRSLTLTSDLISHIPQLERRETLKQAQGQLLASLKDWSAFEALVLEQFQDMGPYWQTLLLRSTREQIQPNLPEEE